MRLRRGVLLWFRRGREGGLGEVCVVYDDTIEGERVWDVVVTKRIGAARAAVE